MHSPRRAGPHPATPARPAAPHGAERAAAPGKRPPAHAPAAGHPPKPARATSDPPPPPPAAARQPPRRPTPTSDPHRRHSSPPEECVARAASDPAPASIRPRLTSLPGSPPRIAAPLAETVVAPPNIPAALRRASSPPDLQLRRSVNVGVEGHTVKDVIEYSEEEPVICPPLAIKGNEARVLGARRHTLELPTSPADPKPAVPLRAPRPTSPEYDAAATVVAPRQPAAAYPDDPQPKRRPSAPTRLPTAPGPATPSPAAPGPAAPAAAARDSEPGRDKSPGPHGDDLSLHPNATPLTRTKYLTWQHPLRGFRGDYRQVQALSEEALQDLGVSRPLLAHIVHRFEKADTRREGHLSLPELHDLVNSLYGPRSYEQAKAMFGAMDLDEDGRVSLLDFITWWRLRLEGKRRRQSLGEWPTMQSAH